MTIEERKKKLEESRKNRPSLPADYIPKAEADGPAFQFARYTNILSTRLYDGGMRRNGLVYEDKFILNAPNEHERLPLRCGCWLIDEKTGDATFRPHMGRFIHDEQAKEIFNRKSGVPDNRNAGK